MTVRPSSTMEKASGAADSRPDPTPAVSICIPVYQGAAFVERAVRSALAQTFDDVEGQISWSHHWMAVDGRLVHHAAPYRYVWPAELDLMARLGGLRRRSRWGGWRGEPFTNDSPGHVTIYER